MDIVGCHSFQCSTKLRLWQARERHEYLCRFEDDWALQELIKSTLKNKRGYMKRLGTFLDEGGHKLEFVEGSSRDGMKKAGGEGGSESDRDEESDGGGKGGGSEENSGNEENGRSEESDDSSRFEEESESS